MKNGRVRMFSFAWITSGVLIVLAAVAVISHVNLLPLNTAISFIDSEWATFLLWAESIRAGHFHAFPFQQNYGGGDLALLRALWANIWTLFDHSTDALVRAQVVFSYSICPILMTWASYFLLRKYCTKSASFIVGLVCAFGFQHWVFQYCNDLYPSLYLIGCFILGWRAQLSNPLFELNRNKVFFLGILLGHAYYLLPAAQIYIVAFLVPLPWALRQIKVLVFENPSQVSWKVLKALATMLILVGLYLEIFGRNLGNVFGRSLKMDGEPNLKVGVLLLFIYWWVRNEFGLFQFFKNHKEFVVKVIVLIIGMFLGDFPEILTNIPKGTLLTPRIWATYDFDTMMKIVGIVPQSLKVLAGAGQTFRALDYTDQTFGDIFSILIILFGFAHLIRRYQSETSNSFGLGNRTVNLDSLVTVTGLSFFLYLRVFTKVPEFAPPRYLFPLFPVIIVSMGIFYDALTKAKYQYLALLCFCLHVSHHLVGRSHLVAEASKREGYTAINSIVETFRQAGVSVVISDDFWHSNTYSFVSQGKPFFWATWRNWGPFEAQELAMKERRVGIMLKQKQLIDASGCIELLGRKFQILRKLSSSLDRELFIAETQE